VIAGVLAAVILVWFLALQIWDVATLGRSLLTFGGILRLLGGASLALAALALLYAGLYAAGSDAFSVLSIVTFLTALVVEFLIGDDVRRVLARKR
jgi:hypothetical protein